MNRPTVRRQLKQWKKVSPSAAPKKPLAISIRLRQPTPREVQVVRLIWAGLKNRQIGERLNISVRTVEAHRSSVMLKLGVSNTAQLLRAAIQQRLV
ncbi:MAG: response regulator transcription factor [Nitrospiraceae bacterium]|nr:response regulator transcription factor [Nitrospiraceae bacterium]